jgi:hypothetical protein
MAPALPTFPCPDHDGLDWFYNTQTGQIQHIKGGTATGCLEWTFFSGMEWYIRFKTEALAKAYKASHPPKKGAGSDIPGIGSGVGQASDNLGIPNNIPNPSDALSGIASTISALSNPNTWLRIGEGILGIVLIGIGLMAVTKSTDAGKAVASTAVKAAKVIK